MDVEAWDGVLRCRPQSWPNTVRVELGLSGVAVTVSGAPDAVAALVEHLGRRFPAERVLRSNPPPREWLDRELSAGAEPNQPTASEWHDLTHREVMVAELVGQAMTNQQIANRLKISPHTVNYHLRQIYRKLAIRSRVQLARLARSSS